MAVSAGRAEQVLNVVDRGKSEPGIRIAPAPVSAGSEIQALVVGVLTEFGLQADLDGVDADVLDVDRHYRQLGGEFYIVEQHGVLIGTMGFVPVSADTCELRKMYLLPAARGRGLGRRLLALAEQSARERGFRYMKLETAAVLRAAVELYERSGYRAVACDNPHAARCDRVYRKAL